MVYMHMWTHVLTSPVSGGLQRCLECRRRHLTVLGAPTHTLSSLSLEVLWHQTLPERGDQSKAPSLLSEADTITTTYGPPPPRRLCPDLSAQSNHTLTPPCKLVRLPPFIESVIFSIHSFFLYSMLQQERTCLPCTVNHPYQITQTIKC